MSGWCGVDKLLELVAHCGGRKIAAGVVIVEGRLALRVPPFLERTVQLGDHWIKRFEVSRHCRGAQQKGRLKEDKRRTKKKREEKETRRKREEKSVGQELADETNGPGSTRLSSSNLYRRA